MYAILSLFLYSKFGQFAVVLVSFVAISDLACPISMLHCLSEFTLTAPQISQEEIPLAILDLHVETYDTREHPPTLSGAILVAMQYREMLKHLQKQKIQSQ